MTMELPNMRVMVFDTETTCLPKSKDIARPDQPWPVQIGAVVMDLSKDTFDETYTTIVRPPKGAFFNPKAVAVHGITEEVANANGISIRAALKDLEELRHGCDVIAAYNLAFDQLIIESAELRSYRSLNHRVLGDPQEVLYHCVMQQAMAHFRTRQKLTQVYHRVTGDQLEGAHDALTDTVAAAVVMKELIIAEWDESQESENL